MYQHARRVRGSMMLGSNKHLRRLHLVWWILASLSCSGSCLHRLLNNEPVEEKRVAFCGDETIGREESGRAPIRRGVSLAVNPKSSLWPDVEAVTLDTCDQTLSVTLKANRSCRSPVLILRVSGAALAFNSSWSYAYTESADHAQQLQQRLVASASFRVYDEGRYYFEVYVEYCERVDPANFSQTCAVVDYENLIASAANQRLTAGTSSGHDASSGILLLPWTDVGSYATRTTATANTAASIVPKPGRWVNRHANAGTVGLSMRFQTARCFSMIGVNGGSKPKRVIHRANLPPAEKASCNAAADLSRFKGYLWEEETDAFPEWKGILSGSAFQQMELPVTTSATEGHSSSRIHMCMIGSSHTRYITDFIKSEVSEVGANIFVTYLHMDFPNGWTEAKQKEVEKMRCSHIITEGFGMWSAGWASNGAWNMPRYRAEMRRLLALINASPGLSGIPVWVRTTNYNPHGGRHLQCPPGDWRTIHIINMFNQAMREEEAIAEAASTENAAPRIRLMDTMPIVGPLFDTAVDWNHYIGPVFDVIGKRILSTVLQHALHQRPQPTKGPVASIQQLAPSLPKQLNSKACPLLCAAQISAFRTLSLKLHAGTGSVRILAIGGSMMAGVGTMAHNGDDSNLEKASSYSSLFATSLAKKYPTIRISYSNHATGGTTTAGSLPQLPLLVDGAGTETVPDLVLIDYSTNDRFEQQDWNSDRDRGKFAVEDNFAPVFAATEAQLRFLLRGYPNTALVMIGSFLEPVPRLAAATHAHANASALYGVPYVQPRAYGAEAPAVGSQITAKMTREYPPASKLTSSTFATTLTQGILHPNALVHKSLALGLLNWWEMMSELAVHCEQNELAASMRPFPEKPVAALANKFHVCEKALSTYSAAEAVTGKMGNSLLLPKDLETGQEVGKAFSGHEASWNLTLQRNRTDKAAWIAKTNGATIDFALRFGSAPRVAVVFMKGYNRSDFGSVLISMPSHKPKWDRFSLKGCCYKDKVTQSHVEVFNVAQDIIQKSLETGVHGFGVKPFSEGVLRISFRKDEQAENTHFAIMHVSSC